MPGALRSALARPKADPRSCDSGPGRPLPHSQQPLPPLSQQKVSSTVSSSAVTGRTRAESRSCVEEVLFRNRCEWTHVYANKQNHSHLPPCVVEKVVEVRLGRAVHGRNTNFRPGTQRGEKCKFTLKNKNRNYFHRDFVSELLLPGQGGGGRAQVEGRLRKGWAQLSSSGGAHTELLVPAGRPIHSPEDLPVPLAM